MKKFLVLSILLLLSAGILNTSLASCSYDSNSASCSSHGNDSDGWYYGYADITNGLTLYMYAVVPTSGTANAYADWDSAGLVSDYSYGYSSTHSPYYYDPYAIPGPISLSVSSTGADSYAGVSVAW